MFVLKVICLSVDVFLLFFLKLESCLGEFGYFLVGVKVELNGSVDVIGNKVLLIGIVKKKVIFEFF